MSLADYEGRHAFITGGASGIGLGMAEAFAQRGMAVTLADVDVARADTEAARLRGAGARARALALDVSDPGAWTGAFDAAEAEFGPLAILCSNAGVAGSVLPLAECSPEGWDWTMAINLDACFHSMRLGAPRLLASGRPAHFVATASMGAFAAFATNGPYSAAKAAVIALCETLRDELKGTPVGVSVLCPGLVKTRLLVNNDALAPPGVGVGGHSATVAEQMQTALAPREVGEIVARGVEARRFWLFTAPQSIDRIRAHFAEIEADAQPSVILGKPEVSR